MTIILEPAQTKDLSKINAVIMRSKAHWGYDDTFMEACRDELSLSDIDLISTLVAVAWLGDAILGVAQLIKETEVPGTAELSKLFVAPEAMGKGVGMLLWDWAIDQAKQADAGRLVLDADPQAEPFYLKMGAVVIGRSPSGAIPGRTLPHMAIDLS